MKNLITENIDVWTTAQIQKNGSGRGNGSANQNLYGIKKLRELILELAVRGKLVPQDLNDEPASVLLEKIAKEKSRLIKEEKIKKEMPLPEIRENEKQMDFPKGWEYIRIGNAMNLINGKAFKPSEWASSGLRIIRIQNLNDYYAPYNYCDFSVDSKFLINDGDFLISWSGTPGTSFGAFIWDRGEAILNQHIFRCELYGESFFTPYLRLAINAELDEMILQAHGGVGLQHITKGKLEKLLITLPPLAEQHRIVAKVDELMILCDKLEQQQNDSNAAHQTLVETLLATLTTSANSDEFIEAWQRIADHFETLFTTEKSIDQLKQTILQIAVMGKLVPQDPNDEPANVLLGKIAKEKARLIREGKIKKEKPLPEIDEEEKPFELPEGWAWTRLGEITNYGISDKVEPGQVAGETWILELEDVEKETSKLLQKVRCTERKFQSSKNIFYKGDVIYGKLRPYLDKVVIADENGICTTEMIPVKGYKHLSSQFLRLVMKSPYFIRYADESTHGMNLPRLGTDKARLALFPLVCEHEQHRIVAKVDELMALCDALKCRLNEAQTTQIQLADAIVEKAVK